MTREHFLILKEEPSEDEEEPNNPAYDALAEMNPGDETGRRGLSPGEPLLGCGLSAGPA